MDFKQAKERLARPIYKSSKNLGHKLVLREDGKGFTLRYFRTDIIRWPNLTDILLDDGGFLSSNVTLQKMNDYLPQGMRITTRGLKYIDRSFVGIVYSQGVVENEYVTHWAVPYRKKQPLSLEGRYEHMLAAPRVNAFETVRRIEEFTASAVNDFLAGKLSVYDVDVNRLKVLLELRDRHSDAYEYWTDKAHVVREALDADITRALWLGVILATPGGTEKISGYWKEYFRFTKASSAKSKKEIVDRMVFDMKYGSQFTTQLLRNSSAFHEYRKKLLEECSKTLLEWAGFDPEPRQSFASHRG